MVKTILIGLFLVMVAQSNKAYAGEFCFTKVYIKITSEDINCDDPPGLLDLTAYNGSCRVDSTSGDVCISSYNVCCDELVVKKYEAGGFLTVTVMNIPVSDYLASASQKFDDLKQDIFAPACDEGFRSTGGGVWSISHPTPALSGEYGKVDYDAVVVAENSCSKIAFSNNTAVLVIGGVDPGGGSSGSGDMTVTNTLLSEIKTVIEGSGNTDLTGTNELLETIRTAVDNGNMKSTEANNLLTLIKDSLAGGIDLGATNGILTEIKTVLENSSGGSGDALVLSEIKTILESLHTGDMNTYNALDQIIKQLTPYNCTTGRDGSQSCTGSILRVSDSAAVGLLSDIKGLLAGSGGGTGGTVNVDMTETNGLLSGITDLMTSVKDTVISVKDSVASLVGSVSGDSSLPGYVDSTLSKSRFVNETMEDIDLFFASDYKSAFSTFQAAAKNTPIFVLINNFFGSVPTGGNSVVSFNGGVFGSHSYDFAKWVGIMSVLKGIILVMFSYACIRILMKR